MITQMKCMQMIYYGKDEFKRFTHYVLMVQLKFELEHNIAEPRQWPQAVRQSHKSKIEGPIVATRTHIYAHDRLYRRVQGVARSPRVPGRHNSPLWNSISKLVLREPLEFLQFSRSSPFATFTSILRRS